MVVKAGTMLVTLFSVLVALRDRRCSSFRMGINQNGDKRVRQLKFSEHGKASKAELTGRRVRRGHA
eukprot:3556967-Pleurochrysis_carterae.AAC.1